MSCNNSTSRYNRVSTEALPSVETLTVMGQLFGENKVLEDGKILFDLAKHDDSRKLIRLVHFLDKLKNGEPGEIRPAYHKTSGTFQTIPLLARNFLIDIPGFICVVKKLPQEFSYSVSIEAFREVLAELDLLKENALYGIVWPTRPNRLDSPAVILFNRLYKALVVKFSERTTKSKLYEERREIQRRYIDYQAYIDHLFEKYHRLLVIRVDLQYKEDFAKKISATDANTHFNRFLGNQRWNKIFKGIVGNISHVEYGVQKGIHFHTILFFNARVRNPKHHIFLGKQITSYWEEVITKGEGYGWNCNANIASHIQKGTNGIGDIYAKDNKTISNLKNHVLGYFFQTEQLFRPKFLKKYRVFRRGVI